jgi:hypothetical protein
LTYFALGRFFCQNAPENSLKQAIFRLKHIDSVLKQGDNSVKQTILDLKQPQSHNDLRRILRNTIDLRDIIMISDLRTKKNRLADVIARKLATEAISLIVGKINLIIL